MEQEIFQKVARRLVAAENCIAFTGAGISVESGIPDFRSAGGLWEKFNPMEYATIGAFREDPVKVWDMLREMDALLVKAEPNPAHLGLARLEEMGVLSGIITQNVDNLHQRAGSKNVVEFHGNGNRLVCIQCNGSLDAAEARRRWEDEFPPRCTSCRAILKPDVVLFGEAIPGEASARAMQMAQEAKVILVIGTSAMVAPASYIPVLAKKMGAFLVEINREHTILSDGVADETIRGWAGKMVPQLLQAVEKLAEEPGSSA